MACLIAVGIIAILSIRWYSSRQVRRGEQPVPGTGWMVPPSYYQSQRQYNQPSHPADGPPVPPYQSEPGAHDAGYYDANGHFISKREEGEFPAAQVREENIESVPDVRANAADYYPPSHPPPGHTDEEHFSPPPGPPPQAAIR